MSEQDAAKTRPPRPKWRRVLRWFLRGLAVVLGLVVIFGVVVVVDGWKALGKAPEGERRARMEASAQWEDGKFVNPQPMWNDAWGMLFERSQEPRVPAIGTFPVVEGALAGWAVAPASGLRVTWLGHSTLWLEIDGFTLLTDPVWGQRTAPVDWLGPERWVPPVVALAEMPVPDAVLISHDHYDHLDAPTFETIASWDTLFVVPLGVAAHLEYWGVPPERIRELDWWDEVQLGDLRLVSTPARHASGRQVFDQMRTLWTSYAIVGPVHRVYFSGDTGLFPGLREIGERFGPFDLTMIESGAYSPSWPDWHLGPEQAVKAHEWVRGKAMLPIHWGMFNLALHSWTAPAERSLAAAQARGVKLVMPRVGELVEPSLAPAQPVPWWPRDIPFRDASAYPVQATRVD